MIDVEADSWHDDERDPTLSRFWVMALVLLWITIQIGLGFSEGIHVHGDAPRYIEGAETLLSGELPEGKALSYIGYTALVAAGWATGLGAKAVVGLQLAFNALATWRFCVVARTLYGPVAAVLSTVALIGCWTLQRLNYFVLTESAFVSAVILLVASTVLVQRRWHILPVILLSVWVALLRPEGFLVVVAVVGFACYRFALIERWDELLMLIVLIVPGVVYGWNPMNEAASREHLLGHFERGTVIWGYPEIRIESDVEIPKGWKNERNAARGVLWLVLHEPIHFARVTGSRLWYFLKHTKPYYSTRHNLAIMFTLYPIYLLALLGLTTSAEIGGSRLLLGLVLLLQAAFVALTFEDWSGRWLLHVMPILLLLAGCGLTRIGQLVHR